jgi:hypothetical protein
VRVVTVVFSEDYSELLEKTSFRSAVWLADTPANHTAAEGAWHAAVEWPHIRVTLFRPPAAHPTRDEWRTLLEQIRLQEGEFATVDVVDSPLTNAARAAFSENGFGRVDETAEGFRARKA